MKKRMQLILWGSLVTSLLVYSPLARANMSASPWIHVLVQKGQNVEVTVNIFEDASWETYHGVPFPSFDVAYSLERWGTQREWVFEDRTFHKEDAVSVSPRMCQWPFGEDEFLPADECASDPEGCVDCDGDGVAECSSWNFCAVAYRFTVVDECVPPFMDDGTMTGAVYYNLTSRELVETSDEFREMEGFGDQNITVADTGDECLDALRDDDNGCSVSRVGVSKNRVGGLGILLMLLGSVIFTS
jgi:hypothetical protein